MGIYRAHGSTVVSVYAITKPQMIPGIPTQWARKLFPSTAVNARGKAHSISKRIRLVAFRNIARAPPTVPRTLQVAIPRRSEKEG